MKLRCAITGASGFVGSLALKKLNTAGHDAFALKRPWQLTNNIDVLIHCAAYIPTSYSDQLETVKCIEDNSLATFKLLDEAEKHDIKLFIYLSSGQIYKWKNGNPEYITASEEDAMDPIIRACPYLISKMTGDCLVRGYKGKIQTVVLRPSSIYGLGMKPVGIIHRLINQIKNKESINIAREDYYTDLVHVDDVVAMIKNCAENKVCGIYNVGGGNPVKTVQLAQMLANIFDTGISFQDTKTELGHPPLDIDKARQCFGYKPRRLKDNLEIYVRAL